MSFEQTKRGLETNENKSELFDRAASRRRVLEKIRNISWSLRDNTYSMPEEWKSQDLEDGKMLAFNPDQIQLLNVSSDEATRYEHQGWTRIGRHDDHDVIVTPRDIMLDFERIPGVELVSLGKGLPVIKIGTLHVMLYNILSLDKYGLEGDEQRVVEIARSRITKEGKSAMMMGKHPEVAEHGFLRETKLLWKQLVAMGYERVISLPTDERRERVYKKMGFVETGKRAGKTNYLVGDLQHMIAARG